MSRQFRSDLCFFKINHKDDVGGSFPNANRLKTCENNEFNGDIW